MRVALPGAEIRRNLLTALRAVWLIHVDGAAAEAWLERVIDNLGVAECDCCCWWVGRCPTSAPPCAERDDEA